MSMGKVIKYLFLLLALIFLVFIIIGFVIISFGNNAKPVKSDCIIVLGCQVYGTVPSPFLRSRLDEGCRLYNEGYGNYIIVSGGKGTGEKISEAQAMKDYLVLKGIPPEKIIIEDKSTSTLENIIFSKEKMNERGFISAVIVSNKYHLKRSSIIARKAGIEGSCSGVFVEQYKSHELAGFLREILALSRCYIIGR